MALRCREVLEPVTDDRKGTTVTLPDTLQITSIKKENTPIRNISSMATDTKKCKYN